MEPAWLVPAKGVSMLKFLSKVFGADQASNQKIVPKPNLIADLAITPQGIGASSSAHLKHCISILERHGLNPQVHACGTNIEGPLGKMRLAIEECIVELHKQGVPKVNINLSGSSRIDKQDSLQKRLMAA